MWILLALFCLAAPSLAQLQEDGGDDETKKEDVKLKAVSEDNDIEFKIDNLITYLVLDKDLSKSEALQAQERSVRYRNVLVKAVGRCIASTNDLGSLEERGARDIFNRAWSRFKGLCIKVKKIHDQGVAPENFENELWVKLQKIIQYILDNKMLLPDEVFSILSGKKRLG